MVNGNNTKPWRLAFFAVIKIMCVLLVKALFKLKVSGAGNIPSNGPCILASNHVTYFDWAILSSFSPRPIRFTMFVGYFLKPLRWFFALAQVVPICSKALDPEVYERAFDELSSHLRQSRMICIFPEGMLTLDGEMHEFKHGIDKILKRNPVPVVPIRLSYSLFGHWSSKSSDHYRFFNRPIIRVVFGKKMEPETVDAHSLEDVVRSLRG